MVDGTQKNAIFSDSDEIHDYHAATGVAILSLSAANAVYIKSHPTHGQKGSILSSDIGRCTFTGFFMETI